MPNYLITETMELGIHFTPLAASYYPDFARMFTRRSSDAIALSMTQVRQKGIFDNVTLDMTCTLIDPSGRESPIVRQASPALLSQLTAIFDHIMLHPDYSFQGTMTQKYHYGYDPVDVDIMTKRHRVGGGYQERSSKLDVRWHGKCIAEYRFDPQYEMENLQVREPILREDLDVVKDFLERDGCPREFLVHMDELVKFREVD